MSNIYKMTVNINSGIVANLHQRRVVSQKNRAKVYISEQEYDSLTCILKEYIREHCTSVSQNLQEYQIPVYKDRDQSNIFFTSVSLQGNLSQKDIVKDVNIYVKKVYSDSSKGSSGVTLFAEVM